jgi:hypothetical protein
MHSGWAMTCSASEPGLTSAVDMPPEGSAVAQPRRVRRRACAPRRGWPVGDRGEVAELRRPADLERLCRDRSLGLAPAVVDELLGAGDGGGMAARRRRTRFAVAPVVAALVVTVALAALAYAGLPDPSGRTG